MTVDVGVGVFTTRLRICDVMVGCQFDDVLIGTGTEPGTKS